MKIIDNIPLDYVKALSDAIINLNFPWYFSHMTVDLNDTEGQYGSFINKTTKDSQQFTHLFFDDNKANSQYSQLVSYMFNYLELDIKNIYRVKANLMLKEPDYPKDFHNIPHGDIVSDKNHKTFLYYINDSDGDTFMFDEKIGDNWKNELKDLTLVNRYKPKGGTGILFDSNQIHASSPPIINNYRAVINCVFEI